MRLIDGQAGPPRRACSARPRPDPHDPQSSSSTTSPRSRRRSTIGDVACVITEPVLTNSSMVLPRAGLPRRAAPPDARGRHAAADRRDPHHLDRPRRLHRTIRPGARPLRAAASRSPAACRPRSGASPTTSPTRSTPCARTKQSRLFRHGHDAVGQSAAARRHARHARRGDDRGGLCPYGAPRRRCSMPGCRGSSRAPACPGMWPASAPASSSSSRPAPAQRQRGGGGAHRPDWRRPIHLGLLNRGVADRALPQHDAGLARDERGGCGDARRGLRACRDGAGELSSTRPGVTCRPRAPAGNRVEGRRIGAGQPDLRAESLQPIEQRRAAARDRDGRRPRRAGRSASCRRGGRRVAHGRARGRAAAPSARRSRHWRRRCPSGHG